MENKNENNSQADIFAEELAGNLNKNVAKEDKGENITPMLEHALQLGKVKTPDDLRLAIDALKSMPDDSPINAESMAKAMEKVKKQKGV